MAVNLTPGTTPGSGGLDSSPDGQALASGTPSSVDPTLEPGQYPGSLFGVALPGGTGAPGSPGAKPSTSDDPTLESGQLYEGISGLGPAQTSDTGAPGTTGAQNGTGGPDVVTYTNPGSYLGGTYKQDTVHESVSGSSDWTQAVDGSYGGMPQLPGIAGNMPAGTGAGEGTVMHGGRNVGG